MKVKMKIMEDGSIVCETAFGDRHYRSRYRGYNLLEAKRRFTKRVIKAEQEELDRVRMEAILMCLHCTLPTSKCKGKCRYEPKNKKKLFRGKGVI